MEFLDTDVNIASGTVGPLFIAFGVMLVLTFAVAIRYWSSYDRMPTFIVYLVTFGFIICGGLALAGCIIGGVESSEQTKIGHERLHSNLKQKYEFDTILSLSGGPSYKSEMEVELLINGATEEFNLVQDTVTHEPFLTQKDDDTKPVEDIEKQKNDDD